MVNVHTLRIIYGHWMLSNALISGFLNSNRASEVPLRRLWLESCSLSVNPINVLRPGQLTGLESIRLRRLAIESLRTIQDRGMNKFGYKLARAGSYYEVHDGSGGWVDTLVQFSEAESPPHNTAEDSRSQSTKFDTLMWENLSEIKRFIEASDAKLDDTLEPASPIEPTTWLFALSASTITSLNLDWILWRRKEDDSYDEARDTLLTLSNLRFPHLRAFQIRNAVLPLTQLPDDVFLLEDTFLGFLEAHQKLQCLGWPMERFYNHIKPTVDVQTRSRKLVAQLAMMLIDLRIDAPYSSSGEPLTDESTSIRSSRECIQRRRFIAEFASHLRKLEHIKLEGGIPRDEKREMIKALHWCPLKKIVMIGVSFPPGNTWGTQGVLLNALDPDHLSVAVANLEEEDLAGTLASYRHATAVKGDFNFEPDYGWPAQAPLLHTVALHHARTVEELKICGYNGCPILSFQTAITHPLLSSLRLFDNLTQLVISFWLLTYFEGGHRDTEIIQSWLDTRSPSSTALTIVTPPASPSRDHPVDPGQFPNFNAPDVPPRAQGFNRWSVALKTQYSPSALAYRVARDIGPFLSPVAKERRGGVRVRASFCLGLDERGEAVNDIFDLDMRIGSENQVLEFVGPREEVEKGRQWDKLEERRWF